MIRHLDQAIRDALRAAPDGRTPIELVDDTGHDFHAVLATLDRLAAAGTATRSRTRIGAWIVTDDPGAAPTPGQAA